MNITERVTGRQFRFVMPGPTLDEPEWQSILDQLGALDPAPRYLVVSGSLPPSVPVDFYARVARLVRPRGVAVVVDASGEPCATQSPKASICSSRACASSRS
jgi:6-phosphofructokinase 2